MTSTFTTLISADELRALLASTAALIVIDTGFDLTDPQLGEREWRAGHVPTSQYLHLDRDLAGVKHTVDGRFRGRHPLPERAAFAAVLGRCGITPARQVVALDRQGGTYAARLWWMLRWMGHEASAVLDGGMAAWVAAGGALTTALTTELATGLASALVKDAPAVTLTPPYPDRAPLAVTTDSDTLAREVGRTRLIDARAGERFRGEVEPLDAAAGHIPGALNRFFKNNLDASGRFKPAGVLHAEFAALMGDAVPASVVHGCGSGVTACHNLLAMTHAGLPGSVLYPGSWSEWSADPGHAIARG